jgi:hypothetical protein
MKAVAGQSAVGTLQLLCYGAAIEASEEASLDRHRKRQGLPHGFKLNVGSTYMEEKDVLIVGGGPDACVFTVQPDDCARGGYSKPQPDTSVCPRKRIGQRGHNSTCTGQLVLPLEKFLTAENATFACPSREVTHPPGGDCHSTHRGNRAVTDAEPRRVDLHHAGPGRGKTNATCELVFGGSDVRLAFSEQRDHARRVGLPQVDGVAVCYEPCVCDGWTQRRRGTGRTAAGCENGGHGEDQPCENDPTHRPIMPTRARQGLVC